MTESGLITELCSKFNHSDSVEDSSNSECEIEVTKLKLGCHNSIERIGNFKTSKTNLNGAYNRNLNNSSCVAVSISSNDLSVHEPLIEKSGKTRKRKCCCCALTKMNLFIGSVSSVIVFLLLFFAFLIWVNEANNFYQRRASYWFYGVNMDSVDSE
eukprot:Pgem_evm1s12020